MTDTKQNNQMVSDEDIDLYQSQLEENLSSYIEHRIECGQDSQNTLSQIKSTSESIIDHIITRKHVKWKCPA